MSLRRSCSLVSFFLFFWRNLLTLSSYQHFRSDASPSPPGRYTSPTCWGHISCHGDTVDGHTTTSSSLCSSVSLSLSHTLSLSLRMPWSRMTAKNYTLPPSSFLAAPGFCHWEGVGVLGEVTERAHQQMSTPAWLCKPTPQNMIDSR